MANIVQPKKGPPCPRCKRQTDIRQHKAITDKHLSQPFYYTEWYACMNRKCRTSVIMPEDKKVYTTQEEVVDERTRLLEEQLAPRQ